MYNPLLVTSVLSNHINGKENKGIYVCSATHQVDTEQKAYSKWWDWSSDRDHANKLISQWIASIGVKIVETLLSFRGYFKLGSNIPHSPHPPGQCCVIFCFLRPFTTAVQHWLGGRGKGFPQKYFFDYFSLKTMKVSSINKVSQLILSPIVLLIYLRIAGLSISFLRRDLAYMTVVL